MSRKLLHKLNELTPEEKKSISKKYPYRFTCVSCKSLYFCNQGYYDEYAIWNEKKNDWVIEDATCMECINKLKIEVCKDEEGYDDGFWRVLITPSHSTHYTRYTSWIKPVISILRKEFGEEDIYCSVKHSCGFFAVYPFVDDTKRYTKDNICFDIKIHKNKVYKRTWRGEYLKNCEYKQIGKF